VADWLPVELQVMLTQQVLVLAVEERQWRLAVAVEAVL
jgi:hypothetical protein